MTPLECRMMSTCTLHGETHAPTRLVPTLEIMQPHVIPQAHLGRAGALYTCQMKDLHKPGPSLSGSCVHYAGHPAFSTLLGQSLHVCRRSNLGASKLSKAHSLHVGAAACECCCGGRVPVMLRSEANALDQGARQLNHQIDPASSERLVFRLASCFAS